MRTIFALAVLVFGTTGLLAFQVTFPDSPVVITELPPTVTNSDRWVARTHARDSDGVIYVVYSTTDAIKVSRSTDNGATWNHFATPGTRIDSDDRLRSPCIAIDPGDTIYVAWKRCYGDIPDGFDVYWSKWNGKTWTAQKNLSQEAGRWPLENFPHFLPSIAIDPAFTPHVVWDGSVTQWWYTIYYTHMDSLGEWAWPPENVGYGDFENAGPNLIGDGRGNIHLGFIWLPDPKHSYAWYRKRFADGQWGESESVCVVLDTLSSSPPSLTIIPGDTLPHTALGVGCLLVAHAPWASIYYRYHLSNGWSLPFKLMPDHYNWFPNQPLITADSQGHLYAAWMLEQYTPSGLMVGRNIWMRMQEFAPFWKEPFAVTRDTLQNGRLTVMNMYPMLGYPVTANGVDLTWVRGVSDSSGTRSYLMYHRLPSLLGVEQEKEKAPPSEPELTLNPRPNPARREMELVYGIPKQEMVNLTVYNLMGERVRTLVHGPTPAGVYRVKWNGKDERLREAPSGTYFFQLTVGEKQVAKKGTLVR